MERSRENSETALLVEVNLYGIDGVLKRGIYSDGKIIDFAKMDGIARPVKVSINKAKNIDLEQVLKSDAGKGRHFPAR